MKKALRYNELDELAWEEEHGCVDHAYGDECWDEAIQRELAEEEDDWYVNHVLSCAEKSHENPQYEEFAEDDETGAGIFGNELNHKQNAQNHCKAPEYCTCVSNGTVYGHGEKDEIERVIFNLLEPFKDYHFEFKFFEAK